MSFFARLKLSYQSRLELSVGNEVLRVVDDRRLVSAVPLRDRAVSLLYCTCTCTCTMYIHHMLGKLHESFV